jgi:hypothetical protein
VCSSDLWRERAGNQRHLSWEDAMASLEHATSEVQEWYRNVNQQCLAANERHIELRSAIAVLRRSVMRTQIPLYPRSIATGVAGQAEDGAEAAGGRAER